MSVTHTYIVPDYYAEFVCKGPDCRSTCCNGWHITLSLPEYYHLLGMRCSKKLRRRLDCAFHMVEDPYEERYAEITPGFDGDCPLRRDDGWCALQKECGEKALSAVCRYYPRSPKSDFLYECSCSNSCEGVLELMFEQKEPLSFQERPLSFELPEREAKKDHRIIRNYCEIRRAAIQFMQDRRYAVPERLVRLGQFMRELYACYEQHRIDAVPDVIASHMPLPDVTKPDLRYALDTQRMLASQFEEIGVSIRSHASEALVRLNGMDAEEYGRAARRFAAIMPEHERLFEHVLVNHMFFECYPFSDKHVNVWEEYVSLCAVYALMRFFSLGCMREGDGMTQFVDMTAATFRLIEHTQFAKNASILLREAHCDTPERLSLLVHA